MKVAGPEQGQRETRCVTITPGAEHSQAVHFIDATRSWASERFQDPSSAEKPLEPGHHRTSRRQDHGTRPDASSGAAGSRSPADS